MKILGIKAGHDSSAAVIDNGNIIADVAEERFTRIKHCSNLPIKSIQYCIQAAKVNGINDLDFIAVAGKYLDSNLRILFNIKSKYNWKDSLKRFAKSFLGASQKKHPFITLILILMINRRLFV